MHVLKRRHAPIRNVNPDSFRLRRIVEVDTKRCGVCTSEWPASMIVLEDGQERCPDCRSFKTEEYKARQNESELEYAAGRLLRPQISQFPLNEVRPSVITSLARSNGTRVTQSDPLLMTRTVNATLIAGGLRFSASDTINYSTGISDGAALSRTATQMTFTLVAAGGMMPGDYNLTFNGKTFHGIFRVR